MSKNHPQNNLYPRVAALLLCCSVLFATASIEGACKGCTPSNQQKQTPQPLPDPVNTYPYVCMLSIPDATQAVSEQWTFKNDFPQYGTYIGFVCVFPNQGPTTLVGNGGPDYTPLQVPLQAPDGTQHLLYLRGYRLNSCNQYSMNSSMGCGQTWSGAILQIEYSPDDNQDLPTDGQLYEGAIPVQALDAAYPDFQQNSVVIINLQT